MRILDWHWKCVSEKHSHPASSFPTNLPLQFVGHSCHICFRGFSESEARKFSSCWKTGALNSGNDPHPVGEVPVAWHIVSLEKQVWMLGDPATWWQPWQETGGLFILSKVGFRVSGATHFSCSSFSTLWTFKNSYSWKITTDMHLPFNFSNVFHYLLFFPESKKELWIKLFTISFDIHCFYLLPSWVSSYNKFYTGRKSDFL